MVSYSERNTVLPWQSRYSRMKMNSLATLSACYAIHLSHSYKRVSCRSDEQSKNKPSMVHIRNLTIYALPAEMSPNSQWIQCILEESTST